MTKEEEKALREKMISLVYTQPEDPEKLLKGRTSEEIVREAIKNFKGGYELK